MAEKLEKPTTQLAPAEYRPFSLLSNEFPSLFQSMFGNDVRRWFAEPFFQGAPALQQWAPRANLKETPEAYVVEAEIPGVKPEEIKVTLTGDVLTIRGEKKTEEKRDQDQWHVWERSFGSFQRSFALPDPVDEKSVTAESTDGLLTVTVKKTAKAPTRQIEVKAKKA